MAENEAALRKAASDGDLETVKKLIGEGVAQTADESGNTPLLLATACYVTEPVYVEIVRELLDRGADINARNKDGDAAIHHAASNGHLEIMELLLENGGDIELEGEQKIVPLGLAAVRKQHAVVNVLVKKLLEEKKFSEKQIKWAYNAATESEQLADYRALTSVFNEKAALQEMVRFKVVDAILGGMQKFSKKSIQTTGLQLLITAMSLPEGKKSGQELKAKEVTTKTCEPYASDPVVQHLLSEVATLVA